MTFLEYLLIGILVGVLASAPVGAVNVMAIQKVVSSGFYRGVYVGLGAVVADALFASAAIFGVSAVTNFIESQFYVIEFVGGALLILFGLRICASHPHLKELTQEQNSSSFGDALQAFFLAITNPGAILAFVAMLGSLGELRPSQGNYVAALVLVLGVVFGATAWWIFLAGLVARFKSAIDDHWLSYANKIAGVLLVAFGALIYVKIFWQLIL